MEVAILGVLSCLYAIGSFLVGRWVGHREALGKLDDSLRRHGVGKPVTLKFHQFQVQGTVGRNV